MGKRRREEEGKGYVEEKRIKGREREIKREKTVLFLLNVVVVF